MWGVTGLFSGPAPWPIWCGCLSFSRMFLGATWSSTTGRKVCELRLLWLGSTFRLWCLFPECVSALLFWFLLSHLVSIWPKQMCFPFKIAHAPLSSLHAVFSVLKRFFIRTETHVLFCFFLLFLLLLQEKKCTCILIWVCVNSFSRPTEQLQWMSLSPG